MLGLVTTTVWLCCTVINALVTIFLNTLVICSNSDLKHLLEASGIHSAVPSIAQLCSFLYSRQTCQYYVGCQRPCLLGEAGLLNIVGG